MLKKIGQKILIAFASAQITAEENKIRKLAKKNIKLKAKEVENESMASVKCPYCQEHYHSSEIWRRAYKPEGLKLERRDSDSVVYLSFVKCRQCNDLFGIEEWYTCFLSNTIRSSFCLKSI